MKIFLAFLLLTALCGCTRQRSLASRLNAVDRVIVANSPYVPAATLTGDELKRVVAALSSARKGGEDVKSSPCFQLEFFKGSNHITTVLVGDTILGSEGTVYSYPTGVIQELFVKFCTSPFVPQ